MTISPERLEVYMRKAAALTHDVVELPPFVLYFSPHDPLRFFNYAKLVEPIGQATSIPADHGASTGSATVLGAATVVGSAPVVGGASTGSATVLGAALAALCEAFEARHRLPRFEFIAEFAPGLPAILQAAGFAEEGRNPLMVCTAETFRPAPIVPGLEIVTLTADAPLADLCAAATVQQRGFGDDDSPEVSEADGERQRDRLVAGAGGFLARLDGVPAAAADFTVPLDGLTELVGIATRAAYRRRGIASALTARAVEEAFSRKVSVVFLGAEDERAGRVYERVGFRPYATALAYAMKE